MNRADDAILKDLEAAPIIAKCEYTFPEVREAMVKASRRALKKIWPVWIIYAAFLIILVWGLPMLSNIRGSNTSAATQPAQNDSPFIVYLPWILIFVFVFFLLRWNARRLTRLLLTRTGPLSRPHTFEFNANGVVIREPLATHHYFWEAFPRFIETPKLFLLFVSDNAMHIVTKRGLADTAAQDRLRKTLVAMIGVNRIPSTGFPVLPVAAAVPSTDAAERAEPEFEPWDTDE